MLNRRAIRSVTAIAAALVCVVATTVAGAADFTVRSGDKTFKLSDARGKFVALHFLMKTECPVCLRHVSEYAQRSAMVAGVQHVFLKPDSEDEIREWVKKLDAAGMGVTIYRDPDAKLADEFKIPGGYEFHGQTVHRPALVLLGPDGAEVFRYEGKDNTDRMPFDRFSAKMAELTRNPAIGQYNLADGVALQGYDPVSYFDGKPQPGDTGITSQFEGVTYRFANKESRQKFADNPRKFAPAYGGWCATAMADGRKVEVEPTNYKITGGRLFLFYKGWLGNAINDWNKDEPNLTKRADAEWRKVAPAESRGEPKK